MAQMNATEQARYEREKMEQIKREHERRYEYERMQQEQYRITNPPGMWSKPAAVYGLPMELIAEIARLREVYKLDYHEIVGALQTLGKIKEGK